jgi:hypothetical protein
MPKNPIQNAAKCPISLYKTRKNIERFGISFKNQRKGLKVLYVLILGGFVMIFVIPA